MSYTKRPIHKPYLSLPDSFIILYEKKQRCLKQVRDLSNNLHIFKAMKHYTKLKIIDNNKNRLKLQKHEDNHESINTQMQELNSKNVVKRRITAETGNENIKTFVNNTATKDCEDIDIKRKLTNSEKTKVKPELHDFNKKDVTRRKTMYTNDDNKTKKKTNGEYSNNKKDKINSESNELNTEDDVTRHINITANQYKPKQSEDSLEEIILSLWSIDYTNPTNKLLQWILILSLLLFLIILLSLCIPCFKKKKRKEIHKNNETDALLQKPIKTKNDKKCRWMTNLSKTSEDMTKDQLVSSSEIKNNEDFKAKECSKNVSKQQKRKKCLKNAKEIRTKRFNEIRNRYYKDENNDEKQQPAFDADEKRVCFIDKITNFKNIRKKNHANYDGNKSKRETRNETKMNKSDDNITDNTIKEIYKLNSTQAFECSSEDLYVKRSLEGAKDTTDVESYTDTATSSAWSRFKIKKSINCKPKGGNYGGHRKK